jgi:hypothetical protein
MNAESGNRRSPSPTPSFSFDFLLEPLNEKEMEKIKLHAVTIPNTP